MKPMNQNCAFLMLLMSILVYLILILAVQFDFSAHAKQIQLKGTHSDSNQDSVSTLVTFRVIMNSVEPPLAPGDLVGLRGSIPPLDWNSSWGMSNLVQDSVFETSVPFDPTYMGDTLEYKFVVERSDGAIQWEGSVGPGGPFGNRVSNLPGGLFDLSLVYFDSAEVSFPVASDDFITTAQDSTTTVFVLANDYDPNNHAITITDLTQPSNGVAQIDPGDATITYIPNPQFYGVDTLSYTITNATNKSDAAIVSVTVLPNIEGRQIPVYENDFEGEVGSEWSNTSLDFTPIGARKFLGQFGNETVTLTLNSLPTHNSITLLLNLFIIRSWDGSWIDPVLGPDIWELSHSGGSILLHTTFRNTGWPGVTQAYPDNYPDGMHSSRTGSTENMTLGYDFYGDAVYNLSFTFPHDSETLTLDFSASGLQEVTDESWGIGYISVWVSGDNPCVSVSPESIDFGNVLVGMQGTSNVTVNNCGDVALTLQAQIKGDHADEFTVAPSSFTVQPDEEQTLQVTFQSDVPGQFQAVLEVGDGQVSGMVHLSATAIEDVCPAPSIASITDVPNDQGKQVTVTWNGACLDTVGAEQPIRFYGIWRNDGNSTSSANSGETNHSPANATWVTTFDDMATGIHTATSGDRYVLDSDGQNEVWTFIGEVPAVQFEQYRLVAPTVFDSTAADGIVWSVFFVSAHTDEPDVWYASAPDSGYSVDNLAPSVPSGLMAFAGEKAIALQWQPNSDEDFKHYTVYRDIASNFQLAEPLAFTADTSFVDNSVELGQTYYYKITATDFSGNESQPSNEVSLVITSVEARSGIPKEFVLEQNYPNPFNPETTIRYQLPQAGHVELTIFNALGEKVRTLVDRREAAGSYQVRWDGRGDGGKAVSSGLYLYRIQTGHFVQTRKMLVLR